MTEQETKPTVTFVPNNKDIVHTTDPDNQDAPTTMAFVVRRATWKDKVEHILRLQRMGQRLDKRSMRAWFKEPGIFLCIEDEEITMIHQEYIVGLAHRSSDED